MQGDPDPPVEMQHVAAVPKLEALGGDRAARARPGDRLLPDHPAVVQAARMVGLELPA